MTDSSQIPRDQVSKSELPKGTVLGSGYEIEEVAGRGGMATVYLAIQKSLDRKVAVKVLHSQFVQDPTFVSRFDAEAGVLANLQHPNVVSIIDRGVENKRYYFVMEWVSGKTLDDRIIEKTITPDDWPEIITGCQAGISYVHKQGVVHRDIKPSNILIGEDNQVKIGDFGIIHILTSDDNSDEAKRRKKEAIGTEMYMAPEQESNSDKIDQRADVYALGVTFFKMFTRRMPKENGKTASAHNSELPVAVDPILEKALEKKCADRYGTVEEFCRHLLRALKIESTSIASVLNKSRVSSSSLYTGQDFTPAPRTPSGADNRLSKLTPLPIGKARRDKTTAGKKSPTSKVQKAKTTKKKVKETTKKILKVSTGVPARSSSASSTKSKAPMIIGAIVVIAVIAVIAGAAFMFLNGGNKGSSRQSQPITPPSNTNQNRSITDERDAQNSEFLDSQGRDIFDLREESEAPFNSNSNETTADDLFQSIDSKDVNVTPKPTPDIFHLNE